MKIGIYLSLFLLLASVAPERMYAGGTLYVTPEQGSYSVGETFFVEVRADSGGEPISAAEAELTFNPANLEVMDINVKDSIMESWPTSPTFTNDEGLIRFAGWAREKYSGKDGLLISILFRALRNSVGNAELAAGAMLAADGVGTNIITSMKSGVYTIEPKKIFPEVAQSVDEESDIDDVVSNATASPTDTEESRDAGIQTSFPRFLTYDREIYIGDMVIVTGIAIPNSEVVVHFAREREKEKKISVVSGSDGSFRYESGALQNGGLYRMKAATMGESGAFGPFSETITIQVSSPDIAATAASFASAAWTAFPMVALLVGLGIGIGYFIHNRRHA